MVRATLLQMRRRSSVLEKVLTRLLRPFVIPWELSDRDVGRVLRLRVNKVDSKAFSYIRTFVEHPGKMESLQ